ncbi:MAG: hypothetical protein ACEY3D_07140 [Rickettsia sp.]
MLHDSYVIPEWHCCVDCFMSFLRKQESSKTDKKLVFLGLFCEY